MSNETEAPFDSGTFGIVITAKAKHGDLFAAAEKAGNQSALAALVGARAEEIGKWINLKSVPGFAWQAVTTARLASIAEKLSLVTGKTITELWPDELQAAIRGGEIGKRFLAHRRYGLEELAHNFHRRSLLPGPQEVVEQRDDKEAIAKLLKHLPFRCREIVKLRYGLDGKGVRTLQEVAGLFGVGKERIRQIEMKGLRLLRGRLEREEVKVARVEEVRDLLRPAPKVSPLSKEKQVATA